MPNASLERRTEPDPGLLAWESALRSRGASLAEAVALWLGGGVLLLAWTGLALLLTA